MNDIPKISHKNWVKLYNVMTVKINISIRGIHYFCIFLHFDYSVEKCVYDGVEVIIKTTNIITFCIYKYK